MHNVANHWFMSFNSNDRIQISDSLYLNLTLVIKNCLKALYKSKVEKNWKLSVAIVPVQKQSDGYNSGRFAIVFATDVLNGLSPVDYFFDVSLMPRHLLQCLETEKLTIFPENPKTYLSNKVHIQSIKNLISKGLSKLILFINASIYLFKAISVIMILNILYAFF